MAESLELTSSEEARVRRVLDSLEVTISEAAGAGPDSLHAAAHRARMRLEQALPPRARPEFRRWMERHHRRRMEEMHGAGGHPHHGEGTESAHPDSATAMVRPRSPHLATGRSRPVPLGNLLAAAQESTHQSDAAAQGSGNQAGAPLSQPGNAAFAAIQEVVQVLEKREDTDWSRVDLEALRQHLLDIQRFTLEARVEEREPVEGGLRVVVTGDGAKSSEEIRGLGYIGLMATGAHHQRHHWMIATGRSPHGS